MTKHDAQGAARGPKLAWHGNDPVEFSRAMAVLKEAEIPSFQLADHEQFTFEMPTAKPKYGIFVRQEDLQRAEKIIADALKIPSDK